MHPVKNPKVVRWGLAGLLAGGLGASIFRISPSASPPEIEGGSASSVASRDLFPHKARIQHAQGFSLRYFPGYKVADIVNPFGASPDTARYILYPRGSARPAVAGRATFVEVPVRTLVCLSTAFLNEEERAEAKFASVAVRYAEIKALAASAREKPKVMGGISRKGVWTVPGGRSYVAALLADAGAGYLWAGDTSTGSYNMAFETAYRQALDAEFWLNAGWSNTLKEITDEDARYGEFKAFKAGKVYNYTKRMGANGSNDYWESGLVNPHLILADFVKVLHPDKLPQHELYYLRKLE